MLDNILNLLDKVRKRGHNKYSACCPVHGDRNPSMSIKETSNGDVLAHCFGCGANGVDVVQALGLPVGELFADELKVDKSRPYYPKEQRRFDRAMIELYERNKSDLYSDYKKYQECKHRLDNFNSKMRDYMDL